jgi:hypothetical protein
MKQRIFLCTVLSVILLALSGCTSLNPVDYDEPIVRAPVSDRANHILANLIEECPIVNGYWRNDLDCTAIQTAVFGYGVGKRRDRKDIIRIGKISAKNESKRIKRFAFSYLMGNENLDLYEAAGFPALCMSGMYDSKPIDYFIYSECLDTFIAENNTNYDVVINMYVSYLLSLRYRAEKHPQKIYLEKARFYADSLQQSDLTFFGAFSYCGIAKASGDPNDLDTAKAIVADWLPKYFNVSTGGFRGPSTAECLSWHLAMIHALADLAQMEPEGPWRGYAMTLLDYVFSDTYFNGKFLVHHINADKSQSPDFCAGCNFAALVLADRLYGDSFIIDPVKKPKQIKAKLKILSAEYGIEDTWTDVTPQLRSKVKHNGLRIWVTNDIAGDPIFGKPKVLRVNYQLGKEEFFREIPEGGCFIP